MTPKYQVGDKVYVTIGAPYSIWSGQLCTVIKVHTLWLPTGPIQYDLEFYYMGGRTVLTHFDEHKLLPFYE